MGGCCIALIAIGVLYVVSGVVVGWLIWRDAKTGR